MEQFPDYTIKQQCNGVFVLGIEHFALQQDA